MDCKGHKDILGKAGSDIVAKAYEQYKLKAPSEIDNRLDKNTLLDHIYLGSWLTDMIQFFSEELFSKTAGLAESINNFFKDILDTILSFTECNEEGMTCQMVTDLMGKDSDFGKRAKEAVKELHKDIEDNIYTLFGQYGASGELAEWMKLWIRAYSYFKFSIYGSDKFCKYDSDSLLKVLDAFLDEKKSIYNFTGSSYPSYHMDRWPPKETRYQQDETRSQTRQEMLDPGIYPYMRDNIEYIAGRLADMDLCWTEPTFNNPKFPKVGEWHQWETEQDLNLALLGHTMHIVEDFFAHSTFVEQVIAGWPRKGKNNKGQHYLDQFLDFFGSEKQIFTEESIEKISNILPPGSLGKKIAKAFIIDKDFTRFNRRLLLFKPEYYDDDNKLKSTPKDKDGNNIEDPNVVTEWFDKWDLLITFEYYASELFFKGANFISSNFWDSGIKLNHTKSPPRYIRNIFDFINNPLMESEIWTENQIKSRIKNCKNEMDALVEIYNNTKEGALFKVPENIVNDIFKKMLPEGTPPWVLDALLKTIIVFNTGKKVGGTVLSIYEVISNITKFISTLLKGPAYIKKWLVKTALGKLISYGVNYEIYLAENWLLDAIGSMRIGCHSLICKDRGGKSKIFTYGEGHFLYKEAVLCAKATDYYVFSNLFRWSQQVCTIEAPMAHSNGSAQSTFDNHKWFDWTELIEYFLAHPNSVRGKKEEFVVFTDTKHITGHTDIRYPNGKKVEDQLKYLGIYYAKTAILSDGTRPNPNEFWKEIAKYNFNTDTPALINAFLKQEKIGTLCEDGINYMFKKGICVNIPYQYHYQYMCTIEDFEYKWFKHVLTDGWECMRKPEAHWHALKYISEDNLRNIIKMGEKAHKSIKEKYRKEAMSHRTGAYKIKDARKAIDDTKNVIDDIKKGIPW